MTSEARASTLWILLLTAASLFTTWALACMTPFAALAALAALHMRRRDGIALMVAAWAASQIVGFGLLHYPHTASTFAWGAGIGLAAVAAVIGARALVALMPSRGVVAPLALSFAGAFVAFKAVLSAFALMLGGIAITLSPKIMAVQIPREAAVLAGLFALYHLLVRLGVPAARGRLASA